MCKSKHDSMLDLTVIHWIDGDITVHAQLASTMDRMTRELDTIEHSYCLYNQFFFSTERERNRIRDVQAKNYCVLPRKI